MKSIGNTIRKLRLEKAVPLRIVAAYLDIDQAILSKIERGQRKASRMQVVKLAKYFEVNEDELIVDWLSDKLVDELENETMALKALQVAEEKVEYRLIKKPDFKEVMQGIKEFFRKDGRVSMAWIFGSYARGESTSDSDIDLMVRFKNTGKASLFDHADIAYLLEQKVKRKIDLVEEGYIKPFAWEQAKNDIKLIYEG